MPSTSILAPHCVGAFAREVHKEITKARQKHNDINSMHEGYAVILEELDELWDEIKKRQPSRYDIYRELIQVAAMAQRFAEDVLMQKEALCPQQE